MKLYYKISLNLRILIAIVSLLFSASTFAQTVTVSGTTPVDIGCEYKYTAAISGVPSGWTIVDYVWQATYIGQNGKIKYVSSFDSEGKPVYTTAVGSTVEVIAKTKDFWVTWGVIFIILRVNYR